MRIIGGHWRGLSLAAVGKGDEAGRLRPTSDRVRESIFNILMSMGRPPDGAQVLDLFAGSGALGIEALSRGAAAATFVESDRRARTAIDANLTATHLADRATVFGRDVRATLSALAGRGARFDLVLVDPPYALNAADLASVLAGIVEVTGNGAQVRLEQGSRLAAKVTWPDGLVQTGIRRYGDTVILEAERTETA